MSTSAAPTNSATAMPTRQRPWWLTLILGHLRNRHRRSDALGDHGHQSRHVPPSRTAVGHLLAHLGCDGTRVHVHRSHRLGLEALHGRRKHRLPAAPSSCTRSRLPFTLPRVFVLVLGIWALMEGIILLFMAFRGGGWGAGILARDLDRAGLHPAWATTPNRKRPRYDLGRVDLGPDRRRRPCGPAFQSRNA